jgi:NTE family protein
MALKNALVLSGGGAKGAFQVGVLDVLIGERGLDFEVLCGVSVGALNAASLAQARLVPDDPVASLMHLHAELTSLRRLWLEEIQGNGSIYSKGILSEAGAILGADSIYNPAGLRKLLQDRLDPQRVVASGRKLRIGLVNLETGEYRTVTGDPEHADQLRDQVLASATMPFYFPPVPLEGSGWADGGLRNITPLAEAFHEKPAAIYAIFTSPLGRNLPREKIEQGFLGLKANAFTFLGRAVQILVDEVYNTDVEGAEDWNTVIQGWKELRPSVPDHPARARLDEVILHKHFAKLYLIQPLDPEAVAYAPLDFTPSHLRRAYEHGREVARKLRVHEGPAIV